MLEYAAQVSDGINPEQAEHEAKVAAMTFGDLAGEYQAHCKTYQRSWKATERIFENHILPVFKDEPLIDVGREKMLSLQQILLDKGLTTQVNRIISHVKACFTWAVEDKQYLEVNPTATLQRKKRRVVETSRDRILSKGELKAIWRAAGTLTEPSKSFVKMLMLTGQRRDEVRCMTPFEVDVTDKNWVLPASRTKAKHVYLVPLAEYTVELLLSVPDFEGGKFVFTVDGEKPYAGARRLKEILDRESKVADWVFHDMRRTFSTGLSSLNIEPHIRRRCPNHSVGSNTSVQKESLMRPVSYSD
jgi:integrase